MSDKPPLRLWLQAIRTPPGRTPEAQRKNADVAMELVEELFAKLDLTIREFQRRDPDSEQSLKLVEK